MPTPCAAQLADQREAAARPRARAARPSARPSRAPAPRRPRARAISTSCCSAMRSEPRPGASGSMRAPTRASSSRGPLGAAPRQSMRRQAPPGSSPSARFSATVGPGTAPAAGRSARCRARARAAGSARSTAWPPTSSRPGVGAVGAGDDLDQRALARAVLADERVHLARPQLERHVREGSHARRRTSRRGRGGGGVPRRPILDRMAAVYDGHVWTRPAVRRALVERGGSAAPGPDSEAPRHPAPPRAGRTVRPAGGRAGRAHPPHGQQARPRRSSARGSGGLRSLPQCRTPLLPPGGADPGPFARDLLHRQRPDGRFGDPELG